MTHMLITVKPGPDGRLGLTMPAVETLIRLAVADKPWTRIVASNREAVAELHDAELVDIIHSSPYRLVGIRDDAGTILNPELPNGPDGLTREGQRHWRRYARAAAAMNITRFNY